MSVTTPGTTVSRMARSGGRLAFYEASQGVDHGVDLRAQSADEARATKIILPDPSDFVLLLF
jgi:hypothetical protein